MCPMYMWGTDATTIGYYLNVFVWCVDLRSFPPVLGVCA